MGEFAVDVTLSEWQRAEAVRHLEQTYNMNYGGLERSTANYFRVPVAECISQAPPAVALRELIAQFRSSGPVRLRLSAVSRYDRARLSALLQQTAYRPARDGNDELARALSQVWTQFDRQAKVPADELERAELVQFTDKRMVGA